MGIYIKGLEMPKSCTKCHLHDFGVCWAFNTKQRTFISDRRPDFCPLTEVPEPHGRLIDADWFFDTFTELANYDTEDNAPTVIEGSE